MIYRESDLRVLCHFNPYHDALTGRFIEAHGGHYIRSKHAPKSSYRRKPGNRQYNKKHVDSVLKSGKTLSTMSYDPDRTKNTDMFYAAYTKLDKHQYNALFNKPIPTPIYDDNNKPVGTGYFLKYRINNKIKKDIKVASEDSASKIFLDLFSKDRDFYNFLTDDNRMEKHFVNDKYKFKGYRQARKVLHKMDDKTYTPSEDDVKTLYRMFNYVIPSQGTSAAEARDVAKQRAKFFTECSNAGYGALLDTNDAIYGGFKAELPVIVFDQSSIIPESAARTTLKEKRTSEMAFAMRKLLGI